MLFLIIVDQRLLFYISHMPVVPNFWSISREDLFKKLAAFPGGLSEAEAANRLRAQRSGIRRTKPWKQDAWLLISQYNNPLILLLVFAVVLSIILGEYSDSLVVLAVLLLTGILGFIQERNAGRAVEKLRALMHSKASVLRDGKESEIPVDEVVSGDIVILNAGDIIPADCFILEENDLHVNDAVLTGESYPSEKSVEPCERDTPLSRVTNCVFKGTSVINGTATVLSVHTGENSELGKIGTSLEKSQGETVFETGIRKFGYLLMKMTVIISVLVLILNVLFQKPLVDSLLFALALAVGLAPELLPAIVTITLSAGARHMAARQVIVRQLNAIQNLGEIDVLCSDKTGTLTEGIVSLKEAVSTNGAESPKVLLYACLNAIHETGFYNPIDEALRKVKTVDVKGFTKSDEVPYDFIRKRLSIVVHDGNREIMISKGAVQNIMDVCGYAEEADGSIISLENARGKILEHYEAFSGRGYRTIGVSYKDVSHDPVINKDDETDMIFLGFVILFDPPKEGIVESVKALRQMGVALKLISGDNPLVVRHLAEEIGLNAGKVVTGSRIRNCPDFELGKLVNETDTFAEVEPEQKERIIKALRRTGHAVGYLGDGINDANAIKAADVGISIDNAVDVAKEAADLVLLQRDIDVIREGILEGRKTFINILKYIYVTTSANFGNMISMAVASLFLPFLPLLPIQILLNNFLSDLPAFAIASDKVDPELIEKPRRWDISSIKRFMVIFGLQSSLFDFATFALLIYVFGASPEEFRTGWFAESLLTEILILLVIRTRRSFFRSLPSGYLLAASTATFALALLLPYIPFASIFSLYPMPVRLLGGILVIALVYVLMSELTKKYLIKSM